MGGVWARLLHRLPARDVTSGFRAYGASVLAKIGFDDLRSRGFTVQIELLARVLALPGARVAEVPIVFRDRARGRSKLSAAVVAEAAVRVAMLRACHGFAAIPRPHRRDERCEPRPGEADGPAPGGGATVVAGPPVSRPALPSTERDPP